MKARFLIPGHVVSIDGRPMTFIKRLRDPFGQATNVFHCPGYVGLDGPKDKGLCSMSDQYFRKHAKNVTVAQARESRSLALSLLTSVPNKKRKSQ